MRDNWFGDWLDVDIVEKDKYAVQVKRNKSLREKKWEMALKGNGKEYKERKENDQLSTYEKRKRK
tara:strand:- start:9704 stop:9898 length:195 start_codon:yes stop_codon:yes gene_type:complete